MFERLSALIEPSGIEIRLRPRLAPGSFAALIEPSGIEILVI